MSSDLEFIETVCANCGYEAKQEIGWLKARADGAPGLHCANCGVPVQYKAQEFDFVLRKKLAGLAYKLRLDKA